MSKVSIVVPCYNEEESIELFYTTVKKCLKELKEIIFEFIFVDDGSKDQTYRVIKKMSENHEDVKYISFSRNFGKEAAIFAGLREASGDCTVVMDVDLQHPPETVIEMLEKWQDGFEVVEGIKINRGKETLFHKCMAKIFYGLISRVIGFDMNNTSDFKLLDKKVVAELAQLKETDTFFRALSFWVGFKSTEVSYEVRERAAGKTKWSFYSLFGYAIKNLIAFSFAPLKLIIIIGVLFLLLGMGFGIDALISYFRGNAAMGYPTLVFLLFMSTGGIMLSLGIVGIYIAKIYAQIKGRPQYIVRDKKVEEVK